MTEKVVNIIGMGWSGQEAPFDQGERWGINCSYTYGEMDRVFRMHHPVLIPKSLRLGQYTQSITEVIEKYPAMEIITLENMLIERNPEAGPEIIFNFDLSNPGDVIKQTRRYPLFEYNKLISCTYATSTLMYIIGLAILEKFDRIRLYGIELFSKISKNEYEFERQGVEHILWLAMGKGIRVEIPFHCLITASNNTNNHYGYKQ